MAGGFPLSNDVHTTANLYKAFMQSPFFTRALIAEARRKLDNLVSDQKHYCTSYAVRDWHCSFIENGLKMPSSVPAAHKLHFFRQFLNALPTKYRNSRKDGLVCPLCGAVPDSVLKDDARHLFGTCNPVMKVLIRVFPPAAETNNSPAHFFIHHLRPPFG